MTDKIAKLSILSTIIFPFVILLPLYSEQILISLLIRDIKSKQFNYTYYKAIDLQLLSRYCVENLTSLHKFVNVNV